jgi:hypothetical protein
MADYSAKWWDANSGFYWSFNTDIIRSFFDSVPNTHNQNDFCIEKFLRDIQSYFKLRIFYHVIFPCPIRFCSTIVSGIAWFWQPEQNVQNGFKYLRKKWNVLITVLEPDTKNTEVNGRRSYFFLLFGKEFSMVSVLGVNEIVTDYCYKKNDRKKLNNFVTSWSLATTF